VVLTGQVPTHLIGNDAFQECDTVGITRPCTKHNYLVKRIEDLPRVLHALIGESLDHHFGAGHFPPLRARAGLISHHGHSLTPLTRISLSENQKGAAQPLFAHRRSNVALSHPRRCASLPIPAL
jgi:hypothetical protein